MVDIIGGHMSANVCEPTKTTWGNRILHEGDTRPDKAMVETLEETDHNIRKQI